MATTTTTTNKPLNPRAQDLSPKGYNRAALFSGKALDFDGVNDILTLPTALTSSLSTTSVTFATYVYPDFTTWSGDRDDAFTFGERGVILAFNSGNIYYYFRHESSGWDGLQVPNAAVTMQAWNHMVVTIDLGTDQYKAYVNGKLVASAGTARASIQYEGNALTIGAQAGARFFDGKIAGFKIFNTALTAAQVADLYLNPEKITPDGVATSALKLWLPMMEGAGASAYDGSGNGNDGTINGATWTAGVGAPVAQTALVSWNKGTNYILNSENITGTGWSQSGAVRTANTAAAPNGTTTADTLADNTTTGVHVIFQLAATISVPFTGEVFLKDNGRRYAGVSITTGASSATRYAAFVDLQLGTITQTNTMGGATGVSSSIASVGNGWYRVRVAMTATTSNDNYLVVSLSNTGTPSSFNSGTLDASYTGDGSSVYVWGTSIRPTSAGDAYIKTNATAQTSAVLVPEGLTAGASIFGTDIITPRNAFALNLDGASWAKVGANASTAFGTGPFTLEAWVKLRYVNTGSYANEIISLNDKDDYAVRTQNTGGISFLTSNVIAYSTSLNGDWAHIVALRETGGTTRLYFNGTQVASGTDNTSIPSANGTRIGTDDTENARTYKDQLANPRIYNRALTAAEVLRNYNADKAKFGL